MGVDTPSSAIIHELIDAQPASNQSFLTSMRTFLIVLTGAMLPECPLQASVVLPSQGKERFSGLLILILLFDAVEESRLLPRRSIGEDCGYPRSYLSISLLRIGMVHELTT